MGRRASLHWDKREQCYRTDAGGKARYFRGIPRDDRVAAAKAFAAWLAELAEVARPQEMTAEDVCVRFYKAPRDVKARTMRAHKERLLVWTEWDPGDDGGVLGERPVSSLTSQALKGPLAKWKALGWSNNYRAGICASVQAAFAWAASEDGGRLISSNPFAEVKPPVIERSPERYATRREIAAFLRFAWRDAKAKPGLRATFAKLVVLVVRIVAQTGARPGELCSAWWSDFDPAKGTITLPPDRHKTGSKTKKNRVIYLSPSLVRALLRERARTDRHPISIFVHMRSSRRDNGGPTGLPPGAGSPWGRFFKLPNGRLSFESNSQPLGGRVRRLRTAAIAEARRLQAANLPTRGLELIQEEGDNRWIVYRLRHTTASDHLMSGGDQSTVAELLGTSPQMLETTYGHLLDDHLARSSRDLLAKRRSRG